MKYRKHIQICISSSLVPSLSLSNKGIKCPPESSVWVCSSLFSVLWKLLLFHNTFSLCSLRLAAFLYLAVLSVLAARFVICGTFLYVIYLLVFRLFACAVLRCNCTAWSLAANLWPQDTTMRYGQRKLDCSPGVMKHEHAMVSLILQNVCGLKSLCSNNLACTAVV